MGYADNYWAPFGYSYLGMYGYNTWRNSYWYDPYYYNGWGRPGALIDGTDDAETGARAVNGVGYTRVSERAAGAGTGAAAERVPPRRAAEGVARPAPGGVAA